MTYEEHLRKYLDQGFIDKLIKAQQGERTNSLILNTNKISSEEFLKQFPKVIKHPFINNAFYYSPKDYEFGKSYLFDNGVFYIMDASSMLVPYLLEVNDNEKILDVCAAPGGKSIFLSLKNPKTNIISNDLSYSRALILSSNIEKMGIGNITVTSCDFSKFADRYINTFDKIILDAPCSGSSMFRKEEKMENDWSYAKVLKCQEIQKNLIKYCITMLKEGGILSYSTCSFSYEEDEEVILNALKENTNISLINIEDNSSFYRTKELPEAIHLFPNLYKGEGQFICLLKKNGILSANNATIDSNKIIKKYGLKYSNEYLVNDHIYLSNLDLNLKNIPIIRNQLFVRQIKGKIEIPTFHLSHYLSNKDSIKLNAEDFKKYLSGNVIISKENITNGFHIVSYNNINLGYIKSTNNTLKNYYPKGLRKTII